MKLKTDNKRVTRVEINGNVYKIADCIADFKETDIEVAKQLGFKSMQNNEAVVEVAEEATARKTSKKKEVANVDKSE